LSLARHTLSKTERLKSYKRIRILFAEGLKFKVQPLLVYYKLSTFQSTEMKVEFLQMGVSVGSRYFKKAVDRNLIKRRIREAYRQNNQDLKQVLHKSNNRMDIFFVYTVSEKLSYDQIQEAMKRILQNLVDKASTASSN
jgi:ribonuclease P protein component